MDIYKWLNETHMQETTQPKSPREKLQVAAAAYLRNPARRRKGSDSSLLVARDHQQEASLTHPAPGLVSSSEPASTESDSSSKQFTRQKRRKTRPDCYEPKSTSSVKHSKGKNKDERTKAGGHRRVRRQKRAQKSGMKLLNDFHAPNVGGGRLTLQPRPQVGIFRRARASSPQRGYGRGLPDLTFSEMQFLSRPFDADHSPQVANPRNARRANSQPEAKEGNPTTFKNDAAQHGEFNGSLGVEGSRHPLTKSSVTPQPVQRSATAGSPRNPLPERDMKACNHSLARSSLRGQFDMDAAIKKCLWRPTTAILAGQLHSPLQTFAERRSADVSSPMQGTPPSMPRRPPSDPGRPTSTGDKRRKPPMPETKETSADEAGAASCYPHESHDGMHTQQCRTIDGPSSPLNRLLRACDTATTALPQQHEDLSLDRTALGMSELLDYSEPIHRLGHNGWRGASYAQFNDSGPIAFTGKHDSFPVMLPTRPQRARLVHGGDALYCQRDGFNFPDSGIGSQQGFPPLILRHDTRGEGRMVYETRIDVSQSRGDIGHDDSVENDQGETLEQPQDWAECLNDARGLCGYASVELDGAPKRDWQFDPCLEADGRVDYQQAADTAAADHPAPEDTEPHGIVPQGFWQRNVLC